ncbi:hypothetical protein LG201_10090 [Methylobacillus gramineus]|uniref:hypothetical protein n=1 Tax=Methylobacillus gramineus TaxID=755169 RepID=UPI001CFF8B5E|nr:hypothetical protein [Methylobacillus gramineus]MCB5185551.1 hypothetical protein [Methylobacillus gramineus]
MNPVIQEEPSGCGIASVAVLAGITYTQAKAVANQLGIFAEDTRLWSTTDYVRRLLGHFSIEVDHQETTFTSWQALPDIALLAIKWRLENGQPYWHWVVFWRSPDGPVILDSKKTLTKHVRWDFGRIKPRWFIPISTS